MDMDAATIIGIYGAALSSALASYQVFTRFRDRPRLSVKSSFEFRNLSEEDKDRTLGTPMLVQHGHDILWREALIVMSVTNEGGSALQIVGAVIESLSDRRVLVREITPPPLPNVLEPLTNIKIALQKEFVDQCESITFIGVVDALGRRHGINKQSAQNLIGQSWRLPTRLAKYRRRDDPGNRDKEIWAFQAKAPASLSSRVIEPGNPLPIVLASRPEISHPSSDIAIAWESSDKKLEN